MERVRGGNAFIYSSCHLLSRVRSQTRIYVSMKHGKARARVRESCFMPVCDTGVPVGTCVAACFDVRFRQRETFAHEIKTAAATDTKRVYKQCIKNVICRRGRSRARTHPVGDGEPILKRLVVPSALVEHVGTDAPFSHVAQW